MLGGDEQMESGFVDFQKFTQCFVFASRRGGGGLFFRPGSFKNAIRWDFARAMIQGWLKRHKSWNVLRM